MATPLQLEVVDGLVKKAIEQGRPRARRRQARALTERGEFFAPTVLTDVTHDMDIMQKETFGPVVLISKFNTDEEAIAIANGTNFGLGSTVFSGNRTRARHIAREIEAGMAGINDYGGLTYMAQALTFGGVKNSGCSAASTAARGCAPCATPRRCSTIVSISPSPAKSIR